MRVLLATALVLLAPAATAQDDPFMADGHETLYVLETIDRQPFDARATILFGADGVVSGDGPCNHWTANQPAPYPWFHLGPIVATRRACDKLADETRFFGALAKMTLSNLQGDRLILKDDAGLQMVFHAAQD